MDATLAKKMREILGNLPQGLQSGREMEARAVMQQIKSWFPPLELQVVKETLRFSLILKQRWFIKL